MPTAIAIKPPNATNMGERSAVLQADMWRGLAGSLDAIKRLLMIKAIIRSDCNGSRTWTLLG
jgi:hypothetical protein